jgi:hypothetical protein
LFWKESAADGHRAEPLSVSVGRDRPQHCAWMSSALTQFFRLVGFVSKNGLPALLSQTGTGWTCRRRRQLPD